MPWCSEQSSHPPKTAWSQSVGRRPFPCNFTRMQPNTAETKGKGGMSRHRCVLGARAAAASRPVEILLSEHVQLPRNRSSEAAARTSSYSLVLAGTQRGLGARARRELPCCFLGQPVNISGPCCNNGRRKLCFERSLPRDILFASFINAGSNSIERGP